MMSGQEKILKWLREEGISPRPVSDQKCDFSYAIDRTFGTALTMAIAKPKNGSFVLLQTQFLIPDDEKSNNTPENLKNLTKEILHFDISDYKIIENPQKIEKINLMCYLYPDDVSKQFLFDAMRKLKRLNAFLEMYFS